MSAGTDREDEFIERHLKRDWEHSVFQTALRVLIESKAGGQPPAQTAMEMADELSLQPHPVFGHRGVRIIASLVADRWCEEA